MKVDDKLFVSFDEDVLSPAGTQIHQEELRAASGPADEVAVRATVELYLRHGGVNTRALLGGTFTPTIGARTTVRLYADPDPIWIDRLATVSSNLGGPSLMCGLPSDLAATAMSSLVAAAGGTLPAGVLEVDRAAHSPVDSSERAYRIVADVLAHAVALRLRGEDVLASLDQLLADSTARPR